MEGHRAVGVAQFAVYAVAAAAKVAVVQASAGH